MGPAIYKPPDDSQSSERARGEERFDTSKTEAKDEKNRCDDGETCQNRDQAKHGAHCRKRSTQLSVRLRSTRLRLAQLLQKLLRETNRAETMFIGVIVGNSKRVKNNSGDEIGIGLADLTCQVDDRTCTGQHELPGRGRQAVDRAEKHRVPPACHHPEIGNQQRPVFCLFSTQARMEFLSTRHSRILLGYFRPPDNRTPHSRPTKVRNIVEYTSSKKVGRRSLPQ
jgi:hypothetical protein